MENVYGFRRHTYMDGKLKMNTARISIGFAVSLTAVIDATSKSRQKVPENGTITTKATLRKGRHSRVYFYSSDIS